MTDAVEIELSRLPSPMGTLQLGVDAQGRLRVLDWETHEARMHRLLARLYGPNGVRLVEGRAERAAADGLRAYLAGEIGALDGIAVETGGTPFQRSVWTGLRAVPAGATWSYGQLARHIGRPTAVRAVGLANSLNPVSIVLPCHRVVGASGALTGYAGGLERKRWLLDHERSAPARLAA